MGERTADKAFMQVFGRKKSDREVVQSLEI